MVQPCNAPVVLLRHLHAGWLQHEASCMQQGQGKLGQKLVADLMLLREEPLWGGTQELQERFQHG